MHQPRHYIRIGYVMFVRFRQTKSSLQVSLVATTRVNGKVQHEHIGGLGAVPIEPDAFDRLEGGASASRHRRNGRSDQGGKQREARARGIPASAAREIENARARSYMMNRNTRRLRSTGCSNWKSLINHHPSPNGTTKTPTQRSLSVQIVCSDITPKLQGYSNQGLFGVNGAAQTASV